MSNDPAFLFYPGDYLRDTQCLSEAVQVAYDRIMCEHMRNICISYDRLNFFTKKLTEPQKDELLSVLSMNDGGYQIAWVAESIKKRRNYSDSRRKNREGKSKNISKSYVPHMENENEIVIEDWIKWGNDIVSKNDSVWEQMRGRVVGKNEMDQFLSVATRNKWKISSQQEFRISLKGFHANGTTSAAAKPNQGKVQ